MRSTRDDYSLGDHPVSHHGASLADTPEIEHEGRTARWCPRARGKVAVCIECPNMRVAGIWLPA